MVYIAYMRMNVYFYITNIMKVSKSLLQTIALAVVVSTTVSACSSMKEQVKPNSENPKVQPSPETPNNVPFNCPACGMG